MSAVGSRVDSYWVPTISTRCYLIDLERKVLWRNQTRAEDRRVSGAVDHVRASRRAKSPGPSSPGYERHGHRSA